MQSHEGFFKAALTVDPHTAADDITHIEPIRWKLGRILTPLWIYLPNTLPRDTMSNMDYLFGKMPFRKVVIANESAIHSAKEIYQRSTWMIEEVNQLSGWFRDFDRYLVKNYPYKFGVAKPEENIEVVVTEAPMEVQANEDVDAKKNWEPSADGKAGGVIAMGSGGKVTNKKSWLHGIFNLFAGSKKPAAKKDADKN